MEMARCMPDGENLSHKFWLDVVMYANYVLNACPTKALNTTTPYEAQNGHTSNVGHMIIFGSVVYVLVQLQQHHKLHDKATKCIFVGQSKDSLVYQWFQATTDKIISSRNIIFAENADQPFVDCSKEPILDQPNVFDITIAPNCCV